MYDGDGGFRVYPRDHATGCKVLPDRGTNPCLMLLSARSGVCDTSTPSVTSDRADYQICMFFLKLDKGNFIISGTSLTGYWRTLLPENHEFCIIWDLWAARHIPPVVSEQFLWCCHKFMSNKSINNIWVNRYHGMCLIWLCLNDEICQVRNKWQYHV